ncbi:formamidopyrimidine-DNA glycosylase isoform X3 [Salvia miltiorrhiza]|uniref:formamidopyrimidine-DNA glycosylase isoform X3 n=1 Tax=Salvia miltiorrhiza TaxID=226208 RepID=UPI0025AC6424|nr:formamidopyrimidine-DNA glycosylase isoform X3 [Salvia miltiorrhiza]
MPELPEVEAARRALAEHTVGKKIIKVIVADDSKVIDGVSPKDFEAALVGKTIVATHRKGKNMWIELDSPPFPSFQFGMAGAVYIKGVAVTKYKRSVVKDTDEWPSKYSKLFVELADGLEFSFTDKRRFAKVRLLDNPVSVPPISELGPDALTEPMTEDELCNSLKKKNIGIKALLLDQSFLSGIGNWMADEVLYQARIHPLQTASSLSKECCTNLLKCINEVTDFAVKVDADSLRFPTEWLFHFRWGKKPGKVIEKALEVGADSSQFPDNWIFNSREKKPGKAFVDGKKLDFIKAGGRTTAYVPELQKLSGNQAVKETDKRSKRTSSGKGGGVDESGSEDEPMEPKVAKGRKSSSASKSSKKKSNASVEDSDGDDVPSKRKRGAKKPPAKSKPKGGKNGEVERRQTRGKGASAKRKHEESDDNLSNSSENGVEDEEEDA